MSVTNPFDVPKHGREETCHISIVLKSRFLRTFFRVASLSVYHPSKVVIIWLAFLWQYVGKETNN